MFFTNDRIVRGKTTSQCDKLDWEPLPELAPEHADTRKYLHLDKEGRAFVCIWPDEIKDDDDLGSYREVDPQRLLDLVLERRQPSRCPE